MVWYGEKKKMTQTQEPIQQIQPEQMKTEPMEKTKLIELTTDEIGYLQQVLMNQDTTKLAINVRAGEQNLQLIDKLGDKN
jgi:hypothetical protein